MADLVPPDWGVQTGVVSLREKAGVTLISLSILHPNPLKVGTEQPMPRAWQGMKGACLEQKSQLRHGRWDL